MKERERERYFKCFCLQNSRCVYEEKKISRERECVRDRGECVCVRERERLSVFVCVGERERKREIDRVCVCERERE